MPRDAYDPVSRVESCRHTSTGLEDEQAVRIGMAHIDVAH